MRIAIGSDHGGFALKAVLLAQLSKQGHVLQDLGCFDTQSVDYPDYGFAVGKAVAEGAAEFGIALCTTGIGICMAANKVTGVRAALCDSVYLAQMTRRHNNANVLCLGATVVSEADARDIVHAFLTTEFEGGRHIRRVEKLNQ